MQIANDFPIRLLPAASGSLASAAPAWSAPVRLAPAQPAAPSPLRATAPPSTPAIDNDLRTGKLMLAVLRSWVARLTRRGRKGHTR